MYISTEGPPDAKIMLVGEAPGSEEDACGRPFVGYSGRTLNTMLSQAGIARHQCLVTNVARERPPANKIHYFFEDKKCTLPKPKLRTWINTLAQEIELYKPNIIVALGATALWALTGEKKISDNRGYILPCTLVPGRKVLPTYHPQAINYEWKLYFPTVLDLRKAYRHSEFSEIPESKQVIIPNAPFEQFVGYMRMLIEHEEFEKLSVDIETDPRHPGSHITELGLSHSANFGISILPVKNSCSALSEQEELLLWQTFADLVARKKIIMQNAAYDTGVLWHNQHILVENIWMDTLIAAHCCWPELPRDLGFLGSICLDTRPWKAAKGEQYNPLDAANTFGIAEVLDKELNTQKIRETFQFEMDLIPVALTMQLQGIEVDVSKQKELIDLWRTKATELKQQLHTMIGYEINFNSPKQVQELLYMKLGLPVQYKRRKSVDEARTPTIDANALRTLSRLVPDNPIFNLILDYKKAEVLVSRFLDIELSPRNTVHTSYNITGASSDDEEDTKKTKRSFGRWSSSASIILPYGGGNLQNIPQEARQMYRAKPGWKIVQADYSQAEAVVVAHLIGDRKLVQTFKDSFGLSKTEKKRYDIHKLTYSAMTGVPVEQVTPEQRTVGKTLRHSTNYAAGPLVLANRLGIKLAEAKRLIELYHRANPLLRMWYETIQAELKRSRTLYNLFGRKHRFMDRWGDTLFRSAYSYIPQSTVGDLLNKALRQIYTNSKDLSYEMIILLQLHDALYVMIEEQYVDETLSWLRERMLVPLTHNGEEFTIDVDFKVGDSWGEGTELDISWRI